MSRFAGRSTPDYEAEGSDTYDPAVDCVCSQCGRRYNGSDSSGGHHVGGKFIGGCCRSFRSLGGFDKHFTGPHTPPGQRRCLTDEELLAKGWTVDIETNVWRMPAPATNPWAKA